MIFVRAISRTCRVTGRLCDGGYFPAGLERPVQGFDLRRHLSRSLDHGHHGSRPVSSDARQRGGISAFAGFCRGASYAGGVRLLGGDLRGGGHGDAGGPGSRAGEDCPLSPRVQLDNLARSYARRNPSWRIVGLRYFNVYGPGETHKNAAASMIYQLYRQMKAGKRPRVFRGGEHKRDFVYIKDVVALTQQALNAPASHIYNCGSGTRLFVQRGDRRTQPEPRDQTGDGVF